jgi:peptidoglycan pentaglycine glycine transferase (the first glycine)
VEQPPGERITVTIKLEMLPVASATAWNTAVAALPAAHLLQSWQWSQLKARYGWRPFYLLWHDTAANDEAVAAALVLERSLAIPGVGRLLRVLYVPKGPLLDWANVSLRRQVIAELVVFARRRGAIFIKIDPDVVLGLGIPGQPSALDQPLGSAIQAELVTGGWRFSQDQIQFRNTVCIDLNRPEEEILAGMKQKTRYNIHLAERKGVQVHGGGPADFGLLYRMYAETSLRDGFAIRSQEYYEDVWRSFFDAGLAEPLIAVADDQPLAALLLFHFAGRAWYLYGMSGELGRERMPNYLLQWQAMRRARALGCTVYDFWGAPNTFTETDPMWGVFRFKDGFGGQVVRTLGAWDIPLRSLSYYLYTSLLPRLLDRLRRRGNARTQSALQEN